MKCQWKSTSCSCKPFTAPVFGGDLPKACKPTLLGVSRTSANLRSQALELRYQKISERWCCWFLVDLTRRSKFLSWAPSTMSMTSARSATRCGFSSQMQLVRQFRERITLVLQLEAMPHLPRVPCCSESRDGNLVASNTPLQLKTMRWKMKRPLKTPTTRMMMMSSRAMTLMKPGLQPLMMSWWMPS